jgi:secondary thiamine-phosphate synthase enzyme
MKVITEYIPVETSGGGDMIDITDQVQVLLKESNLKNGIVTVFSPSATSAITTLEFESGCIKDLGRLFDEIVPPERDYAHNQRWGDGNGHSHVRAALLKPSLTIPFIDGKAALGTWQSIILVDFDNRPRSRKIINQIMGE